eukprot:3852995-Rhodomonas_salina.2
MFSSCAQSRTPVPGYPGTALQIVPCWNPYRGINTGVRTRNCTGACNAGMHVSDHESTRPMCLTKCYLRRQQYRPRQPDYAQYPGTRYRRGHSTHFTYPGAPGLSTDLRWIGADFRDSACASLSTGQVQVQRGTKTHLPELQDHVALARICERDRQMTSVRMDCSPAGANSESAGVKE